MKSRIEKLKDELESEVSKVDFDSYALYDIADMFKQYLRELPEPVLTSKLAETFIAIYKGKVQFIAWFLVVFFYFKFVKLLQGPTI